MADIASARDGAVLRIRLNRPAKKNALTDAMSREIGDLLVGADRDPTINAAVIEAEGPDFCAGNDLGLIRDMASGKVAVEDLSVDHFLSALSTFSKPLLAGVTGHAIGVGATLLLHCDVVYVARDARIRFPFVDLSLVPEAASTYLATLRVGYARAYRLLCLAEAIGGDDASAIGLVTGAVDAADVAARIVQAAHLLAAKPPAALRATKRLMKDHDAIADALARDRAAFIARLQSLRQVPTFELTGETR